MARSNFHHLWDAAHILEIENGNSDNSPQTWDEHGATYIG